jgi:hypothetical protein
MRRRLLQAIAFSTVLLCTYANAQTQTTILGRVMGKGGEVVSGVRLDATNTSTHQIFSTVSSSDGSFRFTVPVGHYSVHYSVEGFKTGTVETDAFVGESKFLNINIYGPEQNGQIRVHVNGPQGTPAAGVKISISSSIGDNYVGTTDAHGDYVQGALGGGTYKVIASAGANPCQNVKISDGQSKPVTLKLSDHCR